MKIGRATIKFNDTYMAEAATVVGEMEHAGPLAAYFDLTDADPYFGKKTWEQAEMKLVELAAVECLRKNKLTENEIDIAFGGDLVNQMVPSNYAMRLFEFPFMGVYSACASVVEAMILASVYVDKELAYNALAFASSHNNMAEKQFRTPVEYGALKPATAQHTATGAGVGLLTRTKTAVKVEAATTGVIIDALQKDPANMGAAMAPAAAHTIHQHLTDLNIDASYYDLIVTGDLARIGSNILIDLLKLKNHDLTDIHNDCGKLLFDESQPVFAGGSGAGCCAVVTFGYLLDQLRSGALKKVLVVATGALLNGTIVMQKETIPCVAHAIALTHVGSEEK